MSVRVYFKPVYESIMSLIVFVDKRLSKNSELGPRWSVQVKEQLKPGFLKKLTGKSLSKDLACLANLMALTHEQPVQTTREFLDWFTELNIKGLSEHFSFSPATLNNVLANLENVKAACNLLAEWDRQYFTSISPSLIEGLQKDAGEKQSLIDKLAPVDFVEKVTEGIRLEDIHVHKKIILVPQHHCRPFNYYDIYPELFISFYPADPEIAPEEPSPHLKRLTSALADESRLKILQFLAGDERTFTEIAGFSRLAKSTVHYHMVLLRAAGLTRVHLKANDSISYSLRWSALDQVSDKLKHYVEQPVLKKREELEDTNLAGKEGK